MNDRLSVNIKDGRSTIKQAQVDILEVLYKYRFGSRSLIANLLKVNEKTLYKKLIVLVKHGLIGSKLDNKSKIKGLPVAYYLTPKGLKFLQLLENHTHITDKIIKSSYRDKSASENTITHSFDVFSQILALIRPYPHLKAYLRRDMSRFSYFPKTLPDAFLSLPDGNAAKRFFFDYISDSQERKAFFQRVYTYIDFFEQGGWNVTNTETPILLFVAEKASTERRIRRLIKGVISKMDLSEEITAYTTTKKAIERIDSDAAIWTSIDEPDELISLV
jgi:DNA-binding PadR family transcriptional regulator